VLRRPDPTFMADITTLLRAAGTGDTAAADQVVALLYDDLHRVASSRLRHCGDITLLDTTSLVHESYLRLQRAGQLDFADRKHFLAYAAKVMRSIVIDTVRARLAERRGGQVVHVPLEADGAEAVATDDEDMLRVHEALDELSHLDARLGRVVEMRYFGGLSESEIADCLGVTERTVQRDWQKARLLLHAALK
jgi:RNA polymerase sigma factor (TIGR02999 family)